MTDRLETPPTGHLTPHVCFHCRKVFKHPLHTDSAAAKLAPAELLSEAVCPNCGETMHGAQDFHTPRQHNVREWRKAEEDYSQFVAVALPHDEPAEPPAEPYFHARKRRAHEEIDGGKS